MEMGRGEEEEELGDRKRKGKGYGEKGKGRRIERARGRREEKLFGSWLLIVERTPLNGPLVKISGSGTYL
jgi:hypothetical protein